MRPGLGLSREELVELTYQLAHRTKGGIPAQYIDTLPVTEVGLYVDAYLKQRDRDEKALDKAKRGQK